MMKYILIFAIIPVMVIVALLLGKVIAPPEEPVVYTSNSISLYCPEDTTLTVQYSEDQEFAKLSLSGMQYELSRTRVASGAKYENSAAGVSIWEHQDEVTVALPGMSEPLICGLIKPDSEEPWATFSAPSSNPPVLTLQHPLRTAVSQVQSTIFEIKYIGPDSEANTEITDGYLATIQLIEGADAQAYAVDNSENGSVATTSFVGYQAYAFSVRSELSNVLIEHHVFANPNVDNQLVDISYQVFADTDGAYEAELIEILNSLSFGSASALIQVESPQAGATVSNPIELSGEARGSWYFEASAPVVVTDWDGRIIGESFITADGDWMTEDFVPFTGSVTYDLPADSYSASGTIIFHRDNPSGLPEHDAAVEIPIMLTP